MVNSFGVCDGAEPVDHRGEGSRGATNGAAFARGELVSRASIVGVAAGVGGAVDTQDGVLIDVFQPLNLAFLLSNAFYGLGTFFRFLDQTKKHMESDAAVQRLAFKPIVLS